MVVNSVCSSIVAERRWESWWSIPTSGLLRERHSNVSKKASARSSFIVPSVVRRHELSCSLKGMLRSWRYAMPATI